MAVRARILAVNQTGSAAMAFLATSGATPWANESDDDMLRDSGSVVLARVLDNLAIVRQCARRAQLDGAPQLGDIANRVD